MRNIFFAVRKYIIIAVFFVGIILFTDSLRVQKTHGRALISGAAFDTPAYLGDGIIRKGTGNTSGTEKIPQVMNSSLYQGEKLKRKYSYKNKKVGGAAWIWTMF